jgi:hypothetical protein
MDVFAFASKSETQGMVLTEAMAAGVPVVALDATGAREVVRDGINGRLLHQEDKAAFVDALCWMAERSPEEMQALNRAAQATADTFSMQSTAKKALSQYATVQSRVQSERHAEASEEQTLDRIINLIKAEWEIVKGMAEAGSAALRKAGTYPKNRAVGCLVGSRNGRKGHRRLFP